MISSIGSHGQVKTALINDKLRFVCVRCPASSETKIGLESVACPYGEDDSKLRPRIVQPLQYGNLVPVMRTARFVASPWPFRPPRTIYRPGDLKIG